MEVSSDKYLFLSEHCSKALLNIVPNLEIVDNSDDEWDVNNILNSNASTYDIMKILYVFEQGGGTLVYNNSISQFPIIIREIGDIKLTDINIYWIHNEANDVLPYYDLGNLIIPSILPKFVATERINYWVIEKLVKGEYIEIKNEKYLSEEQAKNRARELNRF